MRPALRSVVLAGLGLAMLSLAPSLTSAAAAKAGPAPIAYGTLINREFDVWSVSPSRQIAGLDAAATVSISGDPSAQYRINSGSWTRVAATIANGQNLTLRVRTAASGNVARMATATIGSVRRDNMGKLWPTRAAYREASRRPSGRCGEAHFARAKRRPELQRLRCGEGSYRAAM